MLVVDTGPLLEAADPKAPRHRRCVDLLSSARGPLVVPMLVIAEVSHFLGAAVGPAAEIALCASLETGDLLAEPVDQPDWVRIRELLDQYSDLNLGITDASIFAACERLGATVVATLDRRHFSVVRPKHCAALTLLPE